MTPLPQFIYLMQHENAKAAMENYVHLLQQAFEHYRSKLLLSRLVFSMANIAEISNISEIMQLQYFCISYSSYILRLSVNLEGVYLHIPSELSKTFIRILLPSGNNITN